MQRSHYYVMFDEDGWKIQCDGENSDPYPRRYEAFRDAVALAHLDTRTGRQAGVFVQGDDFVFRPQWNSDTDSYPPPPLVPED